MVTGFGQACVEFYPHLPTEPGTDGAPTAPVSTRYTLKNKGLKDKKIQKFSGFFLMGV